MREIAVQCAGCVVVCGVTLALAFREHPTDPLIKAIAVPHKGPPDPALARHRATTVLTWKRSRRRVRVPPPARRSAKGPTDVLEKVAVVPVIADMDLRSQIETHAALSVQ